MNTSIMTFHQRYAERIACLGLLLLPLKLSLSYLCLIPLTVSWLVFHRKQLTNFILSCPLFVPFLFFVVALALSALFGINLSRSLPAVPVLAFYGCLILVFHDLSKNGWHLYFIMCLILGQSIAALHSVIEGALPSFPHLFLGKVTESGQLALTLMCAMSMAIVASSRDAATTRTSGGSPFKLWGLINTILFSLSGFLHQLSVAPVLITVLILVSSCSLLSSIYFSWKSFGKLTSSEPQAPLPSRCAFLIYSVALPLLISAVLINLKRGPWAGLLCGTTVFLFLHARRWLVPVLILSAVCTTVMQPVRSRLLESSRDFFIAGGRSVIWQVGLELSTRYPLGIGFRNSPVLQKFSPEIPPELKHFHSNIINILVECGWITCALFLWWICIILKSAFSYPLSGKDHVLIFGLGCALLSWQIAGLVEYNFGDSEVLCLALTVIGILSRLTITPQKIADAPASNINARCAKPVA